MSALAGQPTMFDETALGPKSGPLQRTLLVAPGVMKRGALIKSKDDVSPELVLHLHGDFRGKAMHGAIEVRFKGDSVIINVS